MTATPMSGVESSKLEAIIETMILAAHADGEFSDDERSHLVASLESLTNGQLSGAALSHLVDRILGDLASEGRPARLASVRDRLGDPSARRVAIELAVRLMAADGVMRTSERELILEIAESFELDPDAVADIVQRHHP